MKQQRSSLDDSHDEGYFASFTDMLVGVIFIFIILLMIVANNFQQATEEVVKVTSDLKATKAEVMEQARVEAMSKTRSEMLTQELDELRKKAIEEEKAHAVAQALADYKASLAAQATQAAPIVLKETQPPSQVKVNNDIDIKQRRMNVYNEFNESRAKVISKIEQAMNQKGYGVTADTKQGTLTIPESALFYGSQGELNHFGKQAINTLAKSFSMYLPCIAQTSASTQQTICSQIGVEPNDGLDVIYIDDYPSTDGSKEDKLLLAVQRVVAVFNQIKTAEPYLDQELKNIHKIPILNIKVNQARRDANEHRRNHPSVKGAVVIRLIMRKPGRSDFE